MKNGKNCPFQTALCGENCALYCIGMKACVLHGINNNLYELVKKQQ